jgi:hypothetical protein
MLVRYVNAVLREWERRGKNNKNLKPNMPGLEETSQYPEMPPWLYCEQLHAYHRHALVKKLPEHYKKFGWSEDGTAYNGSYMWPVQEKNGEWILRWPKASKIPSSPLFTASSDASMPKFATSSKTEYMTSISPLNVPSIPQETLSAPTKVAMTKRATKRNADAEPTSKKMKLRSGRCL